MTSAELSLAWRDYEPDFQTIRPGRWGLRITGWEPANQLGRHMAAFDYHLDLIDERLQQIDDVIAGRTRPGHIGGDNDGSVAYGNGYFIIASSYEERDQLVVTAEMFLAAFQWLRDLVTHPDFTNPGAVGTFVPLVVEVLAHGAGSLATYLELGGSVFVESSPSTDHLN